MSSIVALAETLVGLAKPGMKPKELLAAVRARHPESTKKEVVRAAFYALAESDRFDAEQARELHGFALNERGAGEEVTTKRGRLKKKKHRKAVDAPVAIS